jgi:hypothetical protein
MLSALVVLFLLFDGITEVMKVSSALAETARFGSSEDLIAAVGVILLVCTLIGVIPRTAILGAILLTGDLGGALAVQLRVGNPLFSQTLFPVYFGALVWLGLYVHERRMRARIAFRS